MLWVLFGSFCLGSRVLFGWVLDGFWLVLDCFWLGWFYVAVAKSLLKSVRICMYILTYLSIYGQAPLHDYIYE